MADTGTGIERPREGRQCAPKPVRNGIDALAAAQAVEHLLPEIGAYKGGKNLVIRPLTLAELLYLGAQVLLGLADGKLVDALDVLLRGAPTAGSSAVTLESLAVLLEKDWR